MFKNKAFFSEIFHVPKYWHFCIDRKGVTIRIVTIAGLYNKWNKIELFQKLNLINQFGHKWCRHRLDMGGQTSPLKKTEKTRDFEKKN